jgi:2-polyprenyl-3-methyl-5-hydroxy-6-metoxy-1,4-benzoquinol methylase
MKPCVLCGGSAGKPIWQEQEVDILRCGGCGLIYTDLEGDLAETFWKEPRPEKLDREDFYWDTARATVYDEVLDLLAPPGGLGGPEAPRMLDVGCGKGFFLKRAADRGWKVYGQELSPHAFRFARERLGLQGVAQGRFENVDFPAGTFRVITLWDVIEHLPDPGPMLVKAADLLGDEGVLFIQTPNIGFHLPYARAKRMLARGSRFRRSRKHLLEAKHHLVQFSRETLTLMLARAGPHRIRRREPERAPRIPEARLRPPGGVRLRRIPGKDPHRQLAPRFRHPRTSPPEAPPPGPLKPGSLPCPGSPRTSLQRGGPCGR